MMSLQDIPKVKAGTKAHVAISTFNEIDQERLYLATRAKDLLGYSVLTSEVTGQRTIGTCEGKLTETLLKLDIQTLDTSAVIEYQLEEMTRLNREFMLTHLPDWSGTGWMSKPSTWQKTDLSVYQQPIPEYVLDKAVKIKEALPDVQFRIQHLEDPKADPFLVACHGKEIYFIDAWLEPRFEGKL